MKKYLLSGIMAAALIAPTFANAAPASDTKHPPAPHHQKAKDERHHGHGGHMRHAKGPRHHTMHMAERLAAMETAIGIRSDQLDTWRKYTSALMDMTRHERPKADPKAAPQIFGERFADRIIERVEPAKEFKKAAEELRKVLDKKQLERLQAFSKPHHPGPRHGQPAVAEPADDVADE